MGSLEPRSVKCETERQAISYELLAHFEADGETFLYQIVIADEH
jgi:hypothetical protein